MDILELLQKTPLDVLRQQHKLACFGMEAEPFLFEFSCTFLRSGIRNPGWCVVTAERRLYFYSQHPSFLSSLAIGDVVEVKARMIGYKEEAIEINSVQGGRWLLTELTDRRSTLSQLVALIEETPPSLSNKLNQLSCIHIGEERAETGHMYIDSAQQCVWFLPTLHAERVHLLGVDIISVDSVSLVPGVLELEVRTLTTKHRFGNFTYFDEAFAALVAMRKQCRGEDV